jgi:tRNA-dependent cyclodipeptide synthase
MRKPLAIIGMSPGNSYFKDYEVHFLLEEAVTRFGRCAVMVADVPAIATYMALGYDRSRARNKAIRHPEGWHGPKNRSKISWRRAARDLFCK